MSNGILEGLHEIAQGESLPVVSGSYRSSERCWTDYAVFVCCRTCCLSCGARWLCLFLFISGMKLFLPPSIKRVLAKKFFPDDCSYVVLPKWKLFIYPSYTWTVDMCNCHCYLSLFSACQKGDYPRGLMAHTRLISSGSFSEISTFMPGLKSLMQIATQLRV